ncbi:ABC transporter ATP-binding protein, partial [Vibrio vulnificus]|nr:ABC transporter ATP-binding protein [Vibrio vulnificus]
AETTPALLGAEMMGLSAGASTPAAVSSQEMLREPFPAASLRLRVDKLCVAGDRGERAVHELSIHVRGGEIVGIAGVSGNGQRELMESLVG